MKRKLTALTMASILAISTVMPVYACDKPYWQYDWLKYYEWWQDHYPIEKPEEPEEPEIALEIPEITEAEYHHKTVYYGDYDRLTIDWTEVENAEYYEVEVTAGDGASHVYTETDNDLYVKRNSDDDFLTSCTTRKSETGRKKGTVRVRAMTEEVEGEWCEPVEIHCNGSHFG